MLQMYNFIMGMKFYFSALCLCFIFFNLPLWKMEILLFHCFTMYICIHVYICIH